MYVWIIKEISGRTTVISTEDDNFWPEMCTGDEYYCSHTEGLEVESAIARAFVDAKGEYSTVLK